MPLPARLPSSTARAAAFVLVLLVVATSPAGAFDGARKGFVLGFNAGGGAIWVPKYPYTGETESKAAVATELKIGVGLDERTLLHYAGKQLWNLDVPFTQVFPMIGVTRYLKDSPSSPFFTGGGGVGWLIADLDEMDDSGGFTVFAGGGYEFARHWSVELDYVNMFDSINDHDGRSTHTVVLTVGPLAY